MLYVSHHPNDVVDRSLKYEDTILVEFSAGPIFEVPTGMSVREIAAHLLTPDIGGEVKQELKTIHNAGEEGRRGRERPKIDLFVNGNKSSINQVLTGEHEKVDIEVRKRNTE